MMRRVKATGTRDKQQHADINNSKIMQQHSIHRNKSNSDFSAECFKATGRILMKGQPISTVAGMYAQNTTNRTNNRQS